MDAGLMEMVNRFARATGWLHPLVVAYAGYGIGVFGVLLLAAWWTARRARNLRAMTAALCAVAATALAVALNQPIVRVVARPRPYTTHPGLLVLAHRSSDPSFPSDHATMAGAAAVGLLLVARLLAVVTATAALLLAAARVYIGAHYPGDVLVGLLLGGLVAVLPYALAHRAIARLVAAAGRTRLRPLVAAAPPPSEGAP